MNTITKKICSCCLCAALVLFCIWGSTYIEKHEGHQYDGAAQGFAGEIKVSVFIENDQITDITYQHEGETPSIGGSHKSNIATEDYEATTDVVVVGGGGAGMTAAITVAENGKNVILLEKSDILGGNAVADIVVFGRIAGENASK